MHVPGFEPREVSTLLNRGVIEEHADDAIVLWRMHQHAVGAPLYKLRDLALLDERILAHLEGVQTAGTQGLTIAKRSLASEDPGAVFVVAYLGFSARDTEIMRQIAHVAAAREPFIEAFVSALTWIEWKDIEDPVQFLARSERPEFRCAAVATAAAHRVRAEDLFVAAAHDSSADVRARALKAIGETKCHSLVSVLQAAMDGAEVSCRFWAAWSMALFGDERAAAVAYETGAADITLSRSAIEIAMRAGEVGWARSVVRSLARNGATLREAIIAAAAVGDPASIPWLLSFLAHPEFARLAAEAIATIAGVDLEAAAFKQDAPADAPEPHPDDADLRWPAPQGLSTWWEREQHHFVAGQRLLAGAPVGESAAIDVLRSGYQRQRGAAALELARLRSDTMLFPVAERADRQQRRLGQ